MARPGSYGLDLVGGGQGSTPRKGRRCTMEEQLRAGGWQRLRPTRACFRKPESGGPALGMESRRLETPQSQHRLQLRGAGLKGRLRMPHGETVVAQKEDKRLQRSQGLP